MLALLFEGSLKDERGDHADLEQEMDKEEDSGDKSHKKHRGHDTKEATDDPRRSHE